MVIKTVLSHKLCVVAWILIAVVLVASFVFTIVFPQLFQLFEPKNATPIYSGVITPYGKNITFFVEKPRTFNILSTNYTVTLKGTAVNTSLLFVETSDSMLIADINNTLTTDLTGDGKQDLAIKLLYVEPSLALFELKRVS